jgi:oxygen-independent coproporphyrinogen-3 oxidase
MDKQKKAVDPYISMLCAQIKEIAGIISKTDKKINTVYIGGGTPTSISASQLDTLLNYVSKHLISDNVKEFTVEAGRPDTITEEKLKVLKNHNVSRISINPQTLNDNVLENIGRKHTTQQFVDAFNLARKIGFDNINSDIIAGLPGESAEMFETSLKQLINMNPEGITIHTLCVKRAAELKQKLDSVELGCASELVDLSYSLLKDAEYIPYYMYRQKDTLDNLENTGYSKKGKECLYNVFMMEDMGSVIGIGGGSVSKIIDRKTDRIDRVFNLKHPHEYIKNPDATKERNQKLLELLMHS